MKSNPDSKRHSERSFIKPQDAQTFEVEEETEFGSNIRPLFIPNPVSTYQSLKEKPETSQYSVYSKKKFYRFRSYANPLASFVFCCSDLCTPVLLEYLLKKFFSSKDPYTIHVTILNDQNRAVSLKELCSDHIYFVYITDLGEEAYMKVFPSEEKKIFDSQIVEIISEAEYEEVRAKIGLRYVAEKLDEQEIVAAKLQSDNRQVFTQWKKLKPIKAQQKKKLDDALMDFEENLGNLELETQDMFDRMLGITRAMWEHMQTYKYKSPMDLSVQAILNNEFKSPGANRTRRRSTLETRRRSSIS